MSEDARYGGKPAYAAILEMLRREGASGATVMRGLAGFSMGGRIHTAAIEALSAGLPLKIEWVDTPAQVQRLLPALRRMTGGDEYLPAMADCERALGRPAAALKLVKEGFRFDRALEKQGTFPEEVIYILRIGEMGGDLPGAVRQVAEMNWEAALESMERVSTLVQPAMVLILGFSVGFVVLAILLPIFELSSLAG